MDVRVFSAGQSYECVRPDYQLTATSQFTENEKCLFPAGDAKTLAARIDYWIAHPKERQEEAIKYIGIEKAYSFEDTISKTIKMYRDVLYAC